MSQYRTHVTEKIRAPINEVFDRLSDHNRMGEWMMADIRRTKDSGAAGEGVNGTGSVRTLKIFALSDFDETVVKSERPRTIEYKITRGSPLQNHLGIIALKDEDGVVNINWAITFEMGFAGMVVELLLKLAVANGLAKLKKQIEIA
jgi:uncharacterized protein YndB with AHSA1/START domain